MSVNTIGRYKIIREIARSNDVVYEAVDTITNRRVALKELLLPPNLTGTQRRERIERFCREARAAGLLSHPNIVAIYETGEYNGRNFIAMEYLEGQTLRDVLEIEGKLSPERVTEIAKEVCSALSYAHVNGIVHRDIKPDNIQVLRNSHVKITDFGIARIMEEPTLTADGQVFGTPSYMAPEQIAGKPIDCRADIFSLGVMLYELLTGRKPFTGDTVVTITYNIMNQDISIPPIVPPYFEHVIRKALEKDPERRYRSAADLSADLDSSKSPFIPPYVQPTAVTTTMQPPPQMSSPVPPVPPVSQSFPDPSSFSRSSSYSSGMRLPRPGISDDTKYFLKVFLAVIGVCGLLFGFIWLFMTAYQNSQKVSRISSVDQHVKTGVQYYNQQSYQSAIGEFKWALTMSQDPKQQVTIKHNIANCHIAIGDSEYRQGRVDDAMKSWQQAMEIEPNNIDALDRISAVYLDQGNRAEQSGDIKSALDNWRKAESVGPGTNAGIEAGKNIRRVDVNNSRSYTPESDLP